MLNSTYPLKCFNGFKNWQLNWFASNQVRIMDVSTPRKIAMASFVDYSKAGQLPVLVNINDYLFLQFNRAKLFNMDTEEKRNLLTITRNDPSRSQAVAGLAAGERYTVANWENSGDSLVIQVCGMKYDDAFPEQTDRVVVSIGLNQAYCNITRRRGG